MKRKVVIKYGIVARKGAVAWGETLRCLSGSRRGAREACKLRPHQSANIPWTHKKCRDLNLNGANSRACKTYPNLYFKSLWSVGKIEMENVKVVS